MDYYVIGLLISFCIFIILGTSFNLLFGYAGLVSISHGAFLGIGAYTTGILTILGFDFILASATGVIIAVLFSLLLSIPTLRVSGDLLVLATLGFQVMVSVLFMNLDFITGGPGGLVGIPRPKVLGFIFNSSYMILLLVIVFTLLCIYLVRRSIKGPFGLVLESIKEDETASNALGKNTYRLKVEVFAFTAGLAAVAGSLYAGYIQYISPVEFNLTKSIAILSLVIIGGTQTFWGPIVGAAFIVGIPNILTFINIPVSISSLVLGLAYSTLVIGFLVFLPTGLVGKKKNSKRKQIFHDIDIDEALLAKLSIKSTELMDVIQLRHYGSDDGIVLEVKELHMEFGGLRAVDNLSFSVKKGTCVGLIGPNGAGKTTVFNIIAGVIKQNKGVVKFNGHNINKLKTHERTQKGVARSFQETRLFTNMSVIDNVMVGASNPKYEDLFKSIVGGRKLRDENARRRKKAESLVRYFGLEGKRDELVCDISYAEGKLVMMARILATGAECLLLDEPCSGLDQASRKVIIDTIRELVKIGLSVVLIEHNLDVVREVCSRVVFLDHGSCIEEGTMDEVVSSKELGSIYFGT